MTDYESDSIDGQQLDMIEVSRAEWERLQEIIEEKTDWLDLNAKLNAKFVMQLAEKNKEIERQREEIVYLKSINDDLLTSGQNALIISMEVERALRAQLAAAREALKEMTSFSDDKEESIAWDKALAALAGMEEEVK